MSGDAVLIGLLRELHAAETNNAVTLSEHTAALQALEAAVRDMERERELMRSAMEQHTAVAAAELARKVKLDEQAAKRAKERSTRLGKLTDRLTRLELRDVALIGVLILQLAGMVGWLSAEDTARVQDVLKVLEPVPAVETTP